MPLPSHLADGSPPALPELRRGLSVRGALGINLIDMVGVGPFVTLPLIVGAMGGPQAMLGWVLGALLSLCDGCVWSELGTAYPEAGGSYAYLKHLYGGLGFNGGLGRLLSFLYAFQLLLSAPLSIASGCLGFAQYLSYLLPWAARPWASFRVLGVPVVLSGQTLLAVGVCGLATAVLHREVSALGRVVQGLGAAVIVALVAIIVTGFTHFHPALAFGFPAGAFHLDGRFVTGLGMGLLISAYDYWGYYNVCFLGAEVREPRRAIPRAVLGSIGIVGTLYLLMNVSVLGVLPWRTFVGGDGGAAQSAVQSEARRAAMAVFMRAAYPGAIGQAAAVGIVVLIAVAAGASVFALLLGYSRIPFAAARDGNFPAAFGRLTPGTGVPFVSLRVLAGVTLVCCLFRLQEVISTLVVIRIVFQFLLQGVAVLLPRHRRARRAGAGFRMPLYPLPVLLALAGFGFILVSRPHLWRELRPAVIVLVLGTTIYWLREGRRGTFRGPA